MKASAKTVALFCLVGFFALATSGCARVEEVKKPDPPKNEKANTAVTATKTLGPAGKLVQSFFKNWEFKRYEQMHAQTVNSRDKKIFINRMMETPIAWRNVAILSEEPSDDDWRVTVSLEVTDVPCAFAACMVNLKYTIDRESEAPSFMMSPAFLDIQEFMAVNQTWRIVSLDGEHFIDVCAGSSKGKRHENIINYVLDAATLGDFPSRFVSSSKSDRVAISASSWLALVCMDLKIQAEDAGDIMIKSRPLFRKAEDNMKNIVEKIKSIRGGKKDKDT